jgi:hypothetical protein
MGENELEVVAKAAYARGTGRSDWGDETEWVNETQRTHWRGIARAAIEALDGFRRTEGDRERTHILSELSDLGRQTEGS